MALACLCARIAHCVSILGYHISVLCNQTAAIPVTAVDVNDIIAKSIGASQNNNPAHWKWFVNVWIKSINLALAHILFQESERYKNLVNSLVGANHILSGSKWSCIVQPQPFTCLLYCSNQHG